MTLALVIGWAVIALSGIAAELAFANHRNYDREPDARASDRALRLGVLCATALPVLGALVPALAVDVFPVVVGVAGMTIGLVGVILRAMAMRTLGARYTLTPQRQSDAHVLVRSGPYRVIRHPGYSGLVLQFLGMGLLVSPLLALPAVVPLAIAVLVRVMGEERILVTEFPVDYATYRSAVRARFVPGLI